jgi:hypothetical protein
VIHKIYKNKSLGSTAELTICFDFKKYLKIKKYLRYDKKAQQKDRHNRRKIFISKTFSSIELKRKRNLSIISKIHQNLPKKIICANYILSLKLQAACLYVCLLFVHMAFLSITFSVLK